MNSVITYFKEILDEAKHVTWPSRREVLVSTVIVIIVSVFVAYYLGLLDTIWKTLLSKVLGF